MKVVSLKQSRRGSVLVNSVFIVVLLVMASFAFMRWAADEAHQADYELARTQAYYVAQQGLFEKSLAQMRKTKPSLLPRAEEFYPSGDVSWEGQYVGSYSEPSMRRVSDETIQGVFASRYYYNMSSKGTVLLNSNNPKEQPTEIIRQVSLRAKLKQFSSYMYLTDEEQTVFNEIIWFWTPDTLYGPVHSNAAIGIKLQPMFYHQVSTCADDFIRGLGYNPWFHPDFPPIFNAQRVEFPYQAETLRAHAQVVTNQNGRLQTRMQGLGGGLYYEQWPFGTPYDQRAVVQTGTIGYGNEVGVFVEGELELKGIEFAGRLTIGTSGNMRLINDVRYAGWTIAMTEALQDVPLDYPHMLGLISEQDLIVANTWENGRDNGLYDRAGRHDACHIIITAALVALNESFHFENQNDWYDTYCYCPPCPPSQGAPDERGTIWLRGSVAQRRRGYVHRSTCGGTGYAKDYLYDWRLHNGPPPFFLEAMDDSVALFDIYWWQEENVGSRLNTEEG